MKKILLYSKKLTVVFLILCLYSHSGMLFGQSTANYNFTTGATGSLALDANGNAVDLTSGSTTLVAASLDDTQSALTNIGFDFWFMGTLYTQISASDNGLISFGAQPGTTSYTLPNGTIPTISAFANDMRVGTDGVVRSKVVGTAPNRCLVVEFSNMMIRYIGTAAAGTGTFQVRIYETTGTIEYVYGAMTTNTATPTVYNVGFSADTAANKLVTVNTTSHASSTSATVTNNSYTASSTITSLNSASNGSRRFYKFAQTAPSAPTGFSVTNLAATTMTLNWTDVATDELGYVIYYSTDNVNFTFIGQIAANSTSSNITGLVGSTQYFFKVYAVREGALSGDLSGSQTTLGQATISSSSSWTVPVGVTSVTAECWGAGGGGSSRAGAAGGGGGGAYSRGTFTGSLGGNSITVVVGTGGAAGAPTTAPGNVSSASFGGNTVTANGGLSTNSATGGAGGTASAITGITTASYAGGSGGSANTAGGGGGGSATSTGTGITNGANGGTSATANTAGGTGQATGGLGAASDGGPNATAGSIPGSGGGGRGATGGTSASGANGQVIMSWTCPTYSITTGISATTPTSVGTASTVTVSSTSGALPNGTYTVTYSLSGANTSSGQTATLTVSGGTGTFTTIAIPNAGATTITINNLSNGTAPASCSNAVTSNNTFLFSINSITYNTAGTSSFTVPSGVTCVKVDAVGGGGGGGSMNTNGNNTAGGGGGGAFASGTVSVTSGSSYTVVVGSGGAASTNGGNSTFNSTSVVAAGGSGATTNSATGGLGGTTAASTGNIVTYKGGDAANGAIGSITGGAGGGGAGTTGAGGSTTSATAGTGTSLFGGNGAAGVAGGNNGNAGNTYGGGGSGASTNSNTNRTGGSGANGLVRITWIDAGNFSTSATTTVCSNNPATVTVTSTTLDDGTYTVTYDTTNPASTGNTATMVFSGVTGTFTTVNLTNTTSAAVTSTITITSLTFSGWSCGASLSSGNTANVTVNPKPAITAMTNTACSGVSFTSTPVDSTNGVVPSGTTYSWTAPSVTGGLTGGASGSGSSITGTLTNSTNAAQTATYTVTPTSGSCVGSTFTLTVTINPKPAITAMINTACSGVSFTSTPANGTNGVVPTGTTYSWSAPSVTGGLTGGASGSGSSITGTLTNPTNTAQTATYTVTPTFSGCSGSTFTLTVTVNPKPVITAMTNAVCSGAGFTSTPVNGTNGVVPAGTTYSWSAPSVTGGLTGGASGSGSSISGTLTNPTNTAQTATYTVTPTSGSCPSSTFTLTVTVNPNPAVTAMNNAACSGSGFTSTPANGTNGIVPAGTTYSWSAPSVTGGLTGGASGSGSSITGTLTNPTNTSQTATYTVTPTSGSCSGATFTLTVTVNPTPVITAMTNTVCGGVAFTSAPVNGTNGVVPSGTTYSWSAPSVTGGLTGGASGSGSSITGTLANPTGSAQTATYTVTPISGGCSGATFTLSVTVNPASTAAVISGSAAICAGSTTNLSVAITGGVSPYTVVYSGGTVSSYTSGNNIPVAPTTTTTYTITSITSANGCVGTGNSGSAVVSIDSTTSVNGGAWSNGSPAAGKSVIFDGTNITIGSDFTACSLTLKNASVVTISSGTDVTLTGALAVETGSSFTLNNNANLLQSIPSGMSYTNSGNIVVKRNSSALKRLDYTLWSSPVTGQGIYAFSPSTFANRFYVYRTNTNVYNNADLGFSITGLDSNGVNGTDSNNVQFAQAKGYLIRMPWDHPTAATVWNGQFTGVPNNGDINFTMTNGGAGQRFNLVGNPYPSPINMTQFVSDNSSNITGTLYFWRETNNSTSNNAYCSWAGGTFVSNNEAQVFNPGGIIRTGQGFFVEASGAATSVTFKNGQRSSDNSNQFFRSNSNVANTSGDYNRYWLNLTNASGGFCQMAAGYITNATDGVDVFDGKNINTGNILLNSFLNNTDYTIQGKSLPFNVSDVVPLSYKVTDAGSYTIAIDHVDGFFTDATQAIILKDNLLATEHNLKSGPYNFVSASGTFTNRFEIIYQPQLSVVNPVFSANSVIVYTQGKDNLVVNSGTAIMHSIRVFDISGRLLMEKNAINAAQTTIHCDSADQVLLLQITSEDGVTVTKKVIK